MYEKPTVERFGTFRQLTLLGITGASDGIFINGAPSPGCRAEEVNVNTCRY